MNRNILIIAAAAIVVFLAVLLIPRLLDRDAEEAPTRTASSESSEETDRSSSADDKDEPAAPVADARPANSGLEAGLAEAARQINAQVPISIDELTTVTAARVQGSRIQYRYELSREFSAAQIAQFRQFASTQNPESICGNAETRSLINLGGEIEYVYYGPGDRYLFSTPITSC
ncbi:MAG: hypothetical protein ACSHW2_03575 [Parasphingopyxis sp.]